MEGGTSALPLLRTLVTLGVGGDLAIAGKESWRIGRDTDQSNYNLPTCHTIRLVLCQESTVPCQTVALLQGAPANGVSSLLFQ